MISLSCADSSRSISAIRRLMVFSVSLDNHHVPGSSNCSHETPEQIAAALARVVISGSHSLAENRVQQADCLRSWSLRQRLPLWLALGHSSFRLLHN